MAFSRAATGWKFSSAWIAGRQCLLIRTGTLWAELPEPEGRARVGLSASDILAPTSDPRLAYELMLARNDRILKSPKHSRETMTEFKQDWARLQYARAQARSRLGRLPAAARRRRAPSIAPRSGYGTDPEAHFPGAISPSCPGFSAIILPL